ncbi:MAG: flippase-like domain-containing protein [Elusimicrobia bacterium]|nr:flippase-like domain-containing protein [Elusimicrobiota bacterium]
MPGARRWFTLFVLALGSATFLYLLGSFGLTRVWGHLCGFGWGFGLVVPFQLCDHMLNALGWRFAFPRENAAHVPFWRLVMVRIAGDGVNYLTPSGNIAGEFVRPAMMGDCAPEDVIVSSVFVAKAAQACGQALFVLVGLAWLLQRGLFAFKGRQAFWASLSMWIIIIGVVIVVWTLITPPRWIRARFPRVIEVTEGLRGNLRVYLRRPARLAASTLCFMLGYAWGAAEIWLIASLMGLSLTASQVFAVEVLSNVVDSMFFMVPAKVGTQEAGKTAIFAGLGLPPDIGFMVGLVRHAREILWAGAGFSYYAAHQRRAQTAIAR